MEETFAQDRPQQEDGNDANGSVPVEPEGTGGNLKGAVPKNTNPRQSLSQRVRSSLRLKKKKTGQEEYGDTLTKKGMKVKETSKLKLQKYRMLGEYTPFVAEDDTSSNQVTPHTSSEISTVRRVSLPEGEFPLKLKRESSKSKLAIALVRKITFRKLRKETSLDKFFKTKETKDIPAKSPSTSSEDLDINSATPETTSPGADISDSESGTALCPAPETKQEAAHQTGVEVQATATHFQRSIINNNIVVESDKREISQNDLPSQQSVQTSMIEESQSENTQLSDDTLIQSGVAFVEKGGGESGLGFQSSGGKVSQLGASEDQETAGNAFEREPSFQNRHETRGVELESVEKPKENVVSELLGKEKPDASAVSVVPFPVERAELVEVEDEPEEVATSAHILSTFEGDIDAGAVVSIETRFALSNNVAENEVYESVCSTPVLDRPASREEVRSKILSSWMSQTLSDQTALPPQRADIPANNTIKSKTKGKKLSITTRVVEENKTETEEDPENHESVAASSPSEKPESPGQMLESVPGSSKSESFFTPKDSPSAMSSLDVDNFSQDSSQFFNAEVTVETPEHTFMSPKPDTSLSNGEDVMAEARARLSHSLGVANATATQNQVGDKREHLYKILVIGELGTGKTSIIKRYVHQFFSQHYRATIGVDFALKVLNWDANTIIRLQLWDIAGQERFGNMTRVYYKEAVGAFIVFDVTRAATFDAVVKWKQDLDSKVQLPDGSSIPCVLLANKCDQQKEGLVNQPAKMDEYCKERGFSGWFETSAKENINIEEAARALVTKILQNDQLRIQSDSVKDGEKFNLDGNNLHDEKGKGKCSC